MVTKSVGMVYSGMGPDYRYVKQQCVVNNFQQDGNLHVIMSLY